MLISVPCHPAISGHLPLKSRENFNDRQQTRRQASQPTRSASHTMIIKRSSKVITYRCRRKWTSSRSKFPRRKRFYIKWLRKVKKSFWISAWKTLMIKTTTTPTIVLFSKSYCGKREKSGRSRTTRCSSKRTSSKTASTKRWSDESRSRRKLRRKRLLCLQVASTQQLLAHSLGRIKRQGPSETSTRTYSRSPRSTTREEPHK